ncbi:MAG: DUF5711 family protein [Oscillospiraceae bacterium]
MDEEKTALPPEEQAKKPKKRKKRALWQRVIVLLLLLAVAGGLLFLMLRDSSPGRNEDEYGDMEPYAYETGAGQTFAAAGGGFAVASSSSLQLLDSRGRTVYKQLVSFETPAVFGCEKGALFCSLGGTEAIYAAFDGTVTRLETDGALLSAHLNASGWITLLSEQAGYKGLVQVYDPDGRLIYQWWSGTGYALRAAVSPDCAHLAVLTVGQDGGELRFFSLSSDQELARADFPGELLYDFSYMSADVLCAIGEETVYFVSAEGDLRGSYSLEGRYLSGYDLSSGDFAAICTNAYRTGTGGTVTTLDSSGKVLGTLEVSRDIVAMAAQGKELLLMTSGDVSVYTRELSLNRSQERLSTARDALLLSGGDVLLLSAYAAEKLKF